MYIDTHLHCSKKEGTQPDELIQNAKEVGVSCFIVSCVDRESILEGLELAHSYDSIYLAVGFHPEYASEIQEQDLKKLDSIIIGIKKIKRFKNNFLRNNYFLLKNIIFLLLFIREMQFPILMISFRSIP